MLSRLSTVTRCAIGLMLGYLAFFCTMHYAISDETARGIPFASAATMAFAGRFNPVRVINHTLLRQQPIAVEFVLVLGYLFLCYLWAVRAARLRRAPATLRAMLLWIALFSLPLFFVPQMLSGDVYAYTMLGRISAIHGANPALVPPSAFPADPLLKFMTAWQDQPSVYGPVWLWFSHGLTLIVNLFGQAPWLYVGAYKLAAIGFHMAGSALIWSTLGRWKPEQQVWGTLLYAWNPVVLIEFAGSGHNDALLVFLLLLAVWAAQRGGWRGATAGLSASALTKFVSAPLLPLYAVLLARQRSTWKSRLLVLGQMAGIALLVAALLYAPLWQGGRVLGRITQQPAIDRATKSIGTLAIQGWPALTRGLGLGDDLNLAPDDPNLEADQRLSPQQRAVGQVVRWGGWALVLLAWLLGAWALWRRPSFEGFVAASFWFLLIYVLFGTLWFQPWYTTWPLALAALLDWKPAGRLMAVFTAAAGITYCPWPPAWLLVVYVPVLALIVCYLWGTVRAGLAGTHTPHNGALS